MNESSKIEQAEKSEAFYAPAKARFIDTRSDEMISDRGTILSLLYELLDSSKEIQIGNILKDLVKEQGIVWDASSALTDLLYSAARHRAEQEWDDSPRDYESDKKEHEFDFFGRGE